MKFLIEKLKLLFPNQNARYGFSSTNGLSITFANKSHKKNIKT
jgi:hypothetical protein